MHFQLFMLAITAFFAWIHIPQTSSGITAHLNTSSCRRIVLQALMHAREYPVGLISVDEPRNLTLKPPLQPPRHRLAGPPSTWLTGDWQGTVSTLTFHPGN